MYPKRLVTYMSSQDSDRNQRQSGAVINGSNVKWDNISVQDECPSPVNQKSEITRVR
ncbi:hypothetical protein F2Q69_00043317 [Brassica cretica]|uniref:Uncharacterized protein n=1 Tax=Brassica cretica TaxID=69181 RepID=A0A8S9NP47_BRACR|nr:hypothetical protein F2Q69_00043317 [Brassica cretica]